jgi:hypothetical protein
VWDGNIRLLTYLGLVKMWLVLSNLSCFKLIGMVVNFYVLHFMCHMINFVSMDFERCTIYVCSISRFILHHKLPIPQFGNNNHVKFILYKFVLSKHGSYILFTHKCH